MHFPKLHSPLSFRAPKSQRLKSQRLQDANASKLQTAQKLAFCESQRFGAATLPALHDQNPERVRKESGQSLRCKIPAKQPIEVGTLVQTPNFGHRKHRNNSIMLRRTSSDSLAECQDLVRAYRIVRQHTLLRKVLRRGFSEGLCRRFSEGVLEAVRLVV